MKLLILAAALTFSLHTMATPVASVVNEKVLKTFNQVFSDAKDVHWNAGPTLNEASFNLGTVKTRVVIDNQGNLLRTIRYYKADLLPAQVLYKVKKRYDNKEIYGVTELTVEGGTSYHIIVRDSKHLYNITADNSGNMIQNSKFKRGDI